MLCTLNDTTVMPRRMSWCGCEHFTQLLQTQFVSLTIRFCIRCSNFLSFVGSDTVFGSKSFGGILEKGLHFEIHVSFVFYIPYTYARGVSCMYFTKMRVFVIPRHELRCHCGISIQGSNAERRSQNQARVAIDLHSGRSLRTFGFDTQR